MGLGSSYEYDAGAMSMWAGFAFPFAFWRGTTPEDHARISVLASRAAVPPDTRVPPGPVATILFYTPCRFTLCRSGGRWSQVGATRRSGGKVEPEISARRHARHTSAPHATIRLPCAASARHEWAQTRRNDMDAICSERLTDPAPRRRARCPPWRALAGR